MQKATCYSHRDGIFQASLASLTTATSLTAALTIFSLAALSGCASAPIPTEQFAVSQSAIESATAAGAPEYAPLDIKNARDKLTAAQRAVDKKEYPAAAALAEEAAVDAKLAETKAESAKAQKSVSELQGNLRTLMDEINRNSQQQTSPDQSTPSGQSMPSGSMPSNRTMRSGPNP